MKRSRIFGAGVGLAGAVLATYLVEHNRSARYRRDEAGLEKAGFTIPQEAKAHFLPLSDGGRIHVVEMGEGPTLLLIHGVMLSLDVWAPILRRLSSTNRVIAMSQRGHGHSLGGSEGYGFSRLGQDVTEVLEALDLKDVTLVGHSMGGMVVQRLAARRPVELAQRVKRLVLVATSPGPVIPGRIPVAALHVAERVVRRAAKRGRGIFSSDLGIWLTRIGFGDNPNPEGVELTRQLLSAMDPDVIGDLMSNVADFSIMGRLGAIALPTTVVVGTKDHLTPLRTATRIADAIEGARLEVLNGCGHMVMLERVEKLCALIA
jgi:pimeloyl-ACP methyl ester carboxylesterase